MSEPKDSGRILAVTSTLVGHADDEQLVGRDVEGRASTLSRADAELHGRIDLVASCLWRLTILGHLVSLLLFDCTDIISQIALHVNAAAYLGCAGSFGSCLLHRGSPVSVYPATSLYLIQWPIYGPSGPRTLRPSHDGLVVFI